MKRKEITLKNLAKSLDNVANSIADLATMVTDQFQQVWTQFDTVNQRLGSLEVAQRETNQRLTNLEGEAQATRANIRELYQLASR